MDDNKEDNLKRIFINDVHKYSSRCIAEVVKQHIDYEVIIFLSDQQSFLQFLSSCAVTENSDEEGSDTEPVKNSRPFELAFEIVGTSTVSSNQDQQQWTFPIKLYCVSLPNKRH